MQSHELQIKRILFDADDTLWENNVYYLQAASDFFDLLSRAGISRSEVEKDFDKLEIKVVRERGYGSENFVYILKEIYQKYSSGNGHNIDQDRFSSIIETFSNHPKRKPSLFSNVIETMDYLKSGYSLYVLTKGDYEEQSGKIKLSGVCDYIEDYFVPHEKNDNTYLDLLNRHAWKPEETCMVGNSPKSDINPALRTGMYAIHIPYKDTWKLDNEPIDRENERLIILNAFSDLRNIF
ncbi:MAG: HAD hydrolase-like protein [Calditrichaceae bacterium]